MPIRAAVLTIWAALHLTSEVGSQEPRSGVRPREQYLRAVAVHFRTSFRETEIISAWGLPTDEVPVVLYLASRAGVSTDVVVSFRKDGLGWLELARRLGVGVGDFHVPLEGPKGGLTGAYAAFESRPSAEWRALSLSDPEVVALVNLRVLSSRLSAAPHRVLQAFEETGDFVTVYARLGGFAVGG